MQTNDNTNTKDKILLTAIDLFSKKGFSNVSVRELARTVGIRESSIYNHFSSKKDILDSVFIFLESEIKRNTVSVEEAAIYISNCNEAEFIELAKNSFKQYVSNSTIHKIWKILSAEKFRDERASKILKNIFVDDAIDYQTRLFEILNEKGLAKIENPRSAAIEFQAFNTFLYFRYVELEKADDDKFLMEVEKLIEDHIKFFDKAIGRIYRK